ncbi:MAG TPA: hypothetical protein VJA21_17645 [Verrucomicrobiae bacterium]
MIAQSNRVMHKTVTGTKTAGPTFTASRPWPPIVSATSLAKGMTSYHQATNHKVNHQPPTDP